MKTEDGSRARCRYRVRKRTPDTLCLAAPRNRNNQLWHLEHCRDCQREGPLWNVLESFKPAFRKLLLPACRIKRDHLHCVGISEVCLGGVVKCQVPVLTDSQQAQLGGGSMQLLNILLPYTIGIGRTPIDRKEFSH